jgi:hypothetical protein
VLLVSPNADERYFSNDTITIRYLGSGAKTVSLGYSTDNGGVWTTFASGLPDTGTSIYRWVPGGELGATKIRAMSGSASDVMDGKILILPGRRFLMHTTQNLECGVFSTGHLGGYLTADATWIGPGFHYRGLPNALFSGGVIVGQAGGVMSGMMDSFYTATFVSETPFSDFTSDAIFNQRTTCTIVEQPPYSVVLIDQKTASRPRDDFIIVTYDVKNMMSSTLSGFYVGVFADWDIGSLYTNLGGIDTVRGLAYEYDSLKTDPNFYGVVALSGMSGASVTDAYPDMDHIITPHVESGRTTADQRTFIGSGPYIVAPGEVRTVGFALAAGASLDNLQAHADTARDLWKNSFVTGVTSDRTPAVFSLSQNYPNPFNPNTVVSYQLPVVSSVRLVVYDLLGREVAVLVNEKKTPGTYEVKFDAGGLASGVYFYRLTAGEFVQVRKLLLLR